MVEKGKEQNSMLINRHLLSNLTVPFDSIELTQLYPLKSCSIILFLIKETLNLASLFAFVIQIFLWFLSNHLLDASEMTTGSQN